MEAALISFLVVRMLVSEVRFCNSGRVAAVHFLIFPDRRAELLLDVADTGLDQLGMLLIQSMARTKEPAFL